MSIDAALLEIRAATDEVRTVARATGDSSRLGTAAWLDTRFAEVSNVPELRAAARDALHLWGGMGSFSDVGSTEAHHAVERLRLALRRALSWRLVLD
ncbi:hypothetical protein MT349_16555 [Rathayibacter caricis]|uniref:DUF6966 domain-containing protein n=1 Tax=Rathayibacter caricis TaxID=110936 RepID=UPI001FB56B7A|nr:hypothetical protein [Rathayibacter caricis]MCJ1697398.1 hypothetical protein [Rathayibacter caricis]